MKKIIKTPKINKKALLATLLFASCCLLLVTSAQAQVQLETKLPAISGQPSPSEGLPQYINYLFVFGLGFIAILALAQMIIGGMSYILAAGNVAKVEDAKDMIYQALIGVGILLVSYLLLRTINPDLVNLTNPNLTPTQFQGTNVNQMITPGSATEEKLFPSSETAGKPCGHNGSVSLGGLVCQDGQWEQPPAGSPIYGQ